MSKCTDCKCEIPEDTTLCQNKRCPSQGQVTGDETTKEEYDELAEINKAIESGEKVTIDTGDAEIEIEKVNVGDRKELSEKIMHRGERGMVPLTKEDYFCLNCSKTMENGCECEHADWALGRPEATAHEIIQGATDMFRNRILQKEDFDITKEDILSILETCFPANRPKVFGVDRDDLHR